MRQAFQVNSFDLNMEPEFSAERPLSNMLDISKSL